MKQIILDMENYFVRMHDNSAEKIAFLEILCKEMIKRIKIILHQERIKRIKFLRLSL